jgi:hypothetical protein
MRAIRITEFGGPEVLTYVDDEPEPRPSPAWQVLEVDAAGVNFADTHQAEDTYLAPASLPMIPGAEAVGRLPDGRRVVALLAGGGYAERVAVAPPVAFEVPDEVSDGAALALVLQGTTAWHLLHTSARMTPGESVVVFAAAGGVGSLAVQLAKRYGAGRIIAVASSPDKRDLALRARRRRRHRLPAARTSRARSRRPTAARSTSCSRWSAARPPTRASPPSRPSVGASSTAWPPARPRAWWIRVSSCWPLTRRDRVLAGPRDARPDRYLAVRCRSCSR